MHNKVIIGPDNNKLKYDGIHTQREMSCHHRWYLWLLRWEIHSSIHLRCPWFINSHPDLHITLLVITSALIARTATQRAISSHHQWYLCLLYWNIQSVIHLSFPRFVNIHPALHRKKGRVTSFFDTWSEFTWSIKYHGTSVHSGLINYLRYVEGGGSRMKSKAASIEHQCSWTRPGFLARV